MPHYAETQPTTKNADRLSNTELLEKTQANVKKIVEIAQRKDQDAASMQQLGTDCVAILSDVRERTAFVDALVDVSLTVNDGTARENLRHCIKGVANTERTVCVIDNGNVVNKTTSDVITDKLFDAMYASLTEQPRSLALSAKRKQKQQQQIIDGLGETLYGVSGITGRMKSNPALLHKFNTSTGKTKAIQRAAAVSTTAAIITGATASMAAAYTNSSSEATYQTIDVDAVVDSGEAHIVLPAVQPAVEKPASIQPVVQEVRTITVPAPEVAPTATAVEVIAPAAEASINVPTVVASEAAVAVETVPFMTSGESAAEFYSKVSEVPGLEGLADVAANIDARETIAAAAPEVPTTSPTGQSSGQSREDASGAPQGNGMPAPTEATPAPAAETTPDADARTVVAPWAETMIDSVDTQYSDDKLSDKEASRVATVETMIEYLANNPAIMDVVDLEDEESIAAGIINAGKTVLANKDNDLNRHVVAHTPDVLSQMIASQPEIANYPEETQQLLAQSFAYLSLAYMDSDERDHVMPQSLRDEYAAEAEAKREAEKLKKEEAAAQAAENKKDVVPLTNAQIQKRTLDQLIDGSDTDAKTNTHIALKFFIDNGFTPAQAAGIVGNLLVESASTMDPTIKQFGGGPGMGIAQWGSRDNPKYDRWGYDGQRGLILYAEQRDLDPYDLMTQLNFIMYEFDTTERSAFAKMNGTETVAEAAYAFMKFYERPAADSSAERTERGEAVLEAYQALFDTNKQNDQERVAEEQAEIDRKREEERKKEEERERKKEEEAKNATLSVVSFIPENVDYKRTSDYGPRVFNGQSSVHRGEDFAVPVGTPVLAPAEAVVVRIVPESESGWDTNEGHGSSGNVIILQFTADHPEYPGAYVGVDFAHLSGFPDGLHEGDVVQQGQVVAYSGNTGVSSGPHIHANYVMIPSGNESDFSWKHNTYDIDVLYDKFGNGINL